MEAFVLDWLNLLVRWLHFITGIAWIGSSLYFIWLDNHLEAPGAGGDGRISGELWSVHGGGFYRAMKFRDAPEQMPATLHWFKWEAYWTWLSGMFLLILVYWYSAEVYLVDPAVADLAPLTAVAIAAAFIVGGWLVYDFVCRSPLGRNDALLLPMLLILVALLAWSLCQLFGGRGAYIHFGAVLGTIMVANVFFVIIPGQKQMVAKLSRGEEPDPGPGLRGKQRSVHNTYFTLPVIFVMTSNHFAVTYGHEWNWLILVAVSLAGALIRIWFVARHSGRAPLLPAVLAVVILLAVAAAIAPRSGGAVATTAVRFDDVRVVIEHRCTTCHASDPAHQAFQAAPAGVAFDTDEQIVAEAGRIHQQTVVTKVMPIGNLTGITEEERQLIDRWYQGLGPEDNK